ncbi:tRNA (adenosine(37)-N6)-threonylcarbamoyltransferase complex ATPase subunit type 1 TsaE [Candidatus Peregrinibacteria bacterium]|jgi:tRNA threonylcarbamoyladenosine biosynthesis protein TsaE|nr:tRNA (adenosine(37)-N6)-threonylcarbamoyltransferase complex ATPase subunit type 1 TsaE [Candidatus Peregrinibacteria bacterium]
MLTFHSSSPEETKKIASKLAAEIYPGITILLSGEMGAGKTHFIQGFLSHKIKKNVSISSPTYTLRQAYTSDNQSFVHYDFYRLEKGDFIDTLDEDFFDENTTTLIEWSEKIPSEKIPKTRIEVYIEKSSESERNISIKFIGFSFPKEELNKLIAYYRVPKHIQKHIQSVEKVSLAVADNLISQGAVLDREFIRQAALLHDTVRYIDFRGGLVRENFPYEVDNETWVFWNEMREKYIGKHHADVIAEILSSKGYPLLGEVIVAHKSNTIFEGFDTMAEKTLYYADKRCKHENIVPLLDRIEDLRDRYGDLKNNDAFWSNLREKNLELEKELEASELKFS